MRQPYAAISVVLAAICILAGCQKKNDESTRLRNEILTEVRSAEKMVFASMSITKTAKMEDEQWYKPGKRIAVYSYDSYLRAYIDLSVLAADDFAFDDAARTVHVTLPAVQTEVTGRDMEMRKEYDNIGFLRDSLDSKERAAIKESANASFRKEVEQNPAFRKQLKETAERKARAYFEALFSSYGYTASVTFKNS